jgi:DNA-directed RNA polymerase specialized sigma24 family protein
MPTLPVDIFDRDWERELHSPQLRSRFEAWRQVEPALWPFSDPLALLRFLRRGKSSDAKDAVLGTLVARARWEPIAGRIVLEAIMPGLKNLARRLLSDGRRDREEMWSALMASAWERIRAYPLESRPQKIAANLLLDSLRGTLAALRAAHQDSSLVASIPDDIEDVPSSDGVDAVLDAAVAAGAVSRYEAELILATRTDGLPLSVLAPLHRTSYDTLKRRRHRAELRLRFFLGHRRPAVPREGTTRRYGVARVVGDRPAGHAGGDDQSNP